MAAEDWNSKALASTMGARLEPLAAFGDVSERTRTTYGIGGFHMLHHLMDGDWEVRDGIDKENTAEMVRRIVANGIRQGAFDIETLFDEASL